MLCVFRMCFIFICVVEQRKRETFTGTRNKKKKIYKKTPCQYTQNKILCVDNRVFSFLSNWVSSGFLCSIYSCFNSLEFFFFNFFFYISIYSKWNVFCNQNLNTSEQQLNKTMKSQANKNSNWTTATAQSFEEMK